MPAQPSDGTEDGTGGEGGNLPLERVPQRLRRVDGRVQHEPRDPVLEARGILEGDGRAQADAAHVMILETEPVGEGAEKLRMRGDRERRITGRRLAASGQVGYQ